MTYIVWVVAVLFALKIAIALFYFAVDKYPLDIYVPAPSGVFFILFWVGMLTWCLITLL